jgi:tRNA threonylcarbamoyladenosine biosynthesis protein TsaE
MGITTDVVHNVMLLDLPDLQATITLGRRLARILFPGAVIALIGPLGAGKTHLVRAIAEELGADPRAISSPTFVLVQEYAARLPLFHFDAYRLQGAGAFFDLGAHEYFESNGISLVEWADHVVDCLPREYLRITLGITGETSRSAEIEAIGPKYEDALARYFRA